MLRVKRETHETKDLRAGHGGGVNDLCELSDDPTMHNAGLSSPVQVKAS